MRWTKFIVLFLLVVGAFLGCKSSMPLVTEERLVPQFLTAKVYSNDQGREEYYLKHKYEMHVELGRWLPNRPSSLLVTFDILNTSHVSGFYNHLIAIADPHTGNLLSPVYHFCADKATRRVLRGAEQHVLIYSGYREDQGGPVDRSVLIRFQESEVNSQRLIGEADPVFHAFEIERSRFYLTEVTIRWVNGRRVREVKKRTPLRWAGDEYRFNPVGQKN